MDKTWIKKDRWKSEYSEGVTQFLDFVSENVSHDGLISCPCLKCVNSCSFSRETVQLHLLCNGISKNYSNWFFYGESISETSSSKSTLNHTSKDHDIRSDMHGMLNDLFEVHAASGGENEYVNTSSNNLGEESPSHEQSSRGPSGDAKAFFDLLNDASHPLYDGCKNFSTLSAIVTLLHAKCVNKWSNKSFTDQLDIMRRMLPADSTLPKDYYGAKKYYCCACRSSLLEPLILLCFKCLKHVQSPKSMMHVVAPGPQKYLPPEIGYLTKLMYLDLSFNKLRNLPSEIAYLTDLISLKASNNKLVELPSGLSNLLRLEILDLSNNRLATLGCLDLGSMRSLRKLNLQIIGGLEAAVGDFLENVAGFLLLMESCCLVMRILLLSAGILLIPCLQPAIIYLEFC